MTVRRAGAPPPPGRVARRRPVAAALALLALLPPAGLADGARPAPLRDGLASWVPANAAAVFFPSLEAAASAAEILARRLPEVLPGLCAAAPDGSREPLSRMIDMLLLPTIWRTNPNVKTGTRAVALVVADPDVARAPDVALVCEVEDATRVRGHRSASLVFEDRARARFRTDDLDAWSDDGAVRSFFALEGGVAVLSTTRDLRERILAAGAGRAPSLASAAPDDLEAARTAFPAEEGDGLLVVPAAFLVRANSRELRARHALSRGCEAARVGLYGADLRRRAVPGAGESRLTDHRCPAGGTVSAGGPAGPVCALHGTTAWPVPLGDLPGARGSAEPGPWDGWESLLAEAEAFVAHLRGGTAAPVLSLLLPPGARGAALDGAARRWATAPAADAGAAARARERLALLGEAGFRNEGLSAAYVAWTGRVPPDPSTPAPRDGIRVPPRPAEARVLSLRLAGGAAAWR